MERRRKGVCFSIRGVCLVGMENGVKFFSQEKSVGRKVSEDRLSVAEVEDKRWQVVVPDSRLCVLLLDFFFLGNGADFKT